MLKRVRRNRGAALWLASLTLPCLPLSACSAAPEAQPLDSFAASDLDELTDLDRVIRNRVEAGRYPGAVFLVANADRILHAGAVGEANVETDTPMKVDAIFRTMSMTKPVTAVAVMILVDQGKLDLDDPVSRHLPQFRGFGAVEATDPTPITIRHLLTHSSGLGIGSMLFLEDDLEARMNQIIDDGFGDPPGTQWQYSGLDGFDILARVVEVVSGEDYARFVKGKIFSPLGMKDTTYVLNAEQAARLVGLYAPDEGAFKPGRSFFGELKYASGGAGLYSTGSDFIRFAQMLAGDGSLKSVRILSSASVNEMSRAQLASGSAGLPPGLSWGLGMRRVADPVLLNSPLPAGSYGWSGAYGTHFWVDPQHELAAVFMINLTTAGGASSPDALDFERIVMRVCQTDVRCGLGESKEQQ